MSEGQQEFLLKKLANNFVKDNICSENWEASLKSHFKIFILLITTVKPKTIF